MPVLSHGLNMTVFWLGCRPAARLSAAERINTSWVHDWSTRAGLYARIDEWVEALDKSAGDWKQKEPKEAINEKIYPDESRFENECWAEVCEIITWHLLRLHRWCYEDVIDSCGKIFEVNYFLTFSDCWNLDEVTFQDFQERRCFGSWDARSVSWS